MKARRSRRVVLNSTGSIRPKVGIDMRLAAILLVLLGPLIGHAAYAQQIDATPRVAVIAAYKVEWVALKNAMSETHTEKIADTTYIAGKLYGKDIVLFLSGISMVNAAMTTQGAIDHFKITRIVFSGIAGGIKPGLSAGGRVRGAPSGGDLAFFFAPQ